MKSEESPVRRRASQTQRGRKRHKLGGRLQRFSASPRIGPPRSDTRPAAARQPKGEYPSVPDTVVDRRPPVAQKPLTASALALLELYYRLNAFVMATEEKAPVEWGAERILGVRKARAYAILREITNGDFDGPYVGPTPTVCPATGCGIVRIFLGPTRPFADIQQSLATGHPVDGLPASLIPDVNTAANIITALICHADGKKPTSVCGRPVIRAILRSVK